VQMSEITPIKLTPDMPEWKTFLTHNEHYIFHRPEYLRFIEETFPTVKSSYIGIVENNNLKLVFPFFHISQPGLRKVLSTGFSLFEEKLISCAFNDYGGPCGDADTDKLYAILKVVKARFNAPYIEIRQGLEKFDEPFKNLRKQTYKRFILSLGNKEHIWNGIQKYKRKAINKAASSGITTREISSDEVDSLYALYSLNMRAFGDPPYPKAFFANFYKHFVSAGLGKCFGAYLDGKLVAMLLGYCCSGRVHIIIAVSDDKYLDLRPNDAVHWAFISWACDNGYKLFDFGHTRENSGQFEYKQKWGGECRNLNRYYFIESDKELPAIDPTNPKYKSLINVWKKLPLPVTTTVGPWLREGFGI
jgi:serine/alanine adding enzyme